MGTFGRSEGYTDTSGRFVALTGKLVKFVTLRQSKLCFQGEGSWFVYSRQIMLSM